MSLVVPADDGLDVPGKLDGREQLDPPDRVHLQHRELVRRQFAGLAQDFVRDAHLADVMEVGADPHRRLGVLVHAEELRHGDSAPRHTLTVPESVGVVRLDRVTPLADHRQVRGLELGHLAVDVDQLGACVEPFEQRVGVVEERQRVLITAHRLVQDGQLAACGRLVQYRAGVHRELDRRAQPRLGQSRPAGLPIHHADDAIRLGAQHAAVDPV